VSEIIANFFSKLELLDKATHYRSQEYGKDKPGPISKIVEREPCWHCRHTIRLTTDSGVNATFIRLHPNCVVGTMQAAEKGVNR